MSGLWAQIRVRFVASTEPFVNSLVETFDPFRREFDQNAPALVL
jgi:hypothetical protein